MLPFSFRNKNSHSILQNSSQISSFISERFLDSLLVFNQNFLKETIFCLNLAGRQCFSWTETFLHDQFLSFSCFNFLTLLAEPFDQRAWCQLVSTLAGHPRDQLERCPPITTARITAAWWDFYGLDLTLLSTRSLATERCQTALGSNTNTAKN